MCPIVGRMTSVGFNWSGSRVRVIAVNLFRTRKLYIVLLYGYFMPESATRIGSGHMYVKDGPWWRGRPLTDRVSSPCMALERVLSTAAPSKSMLRHKRSKLIKVKYLSDQDRLKYMAWSPQVFLIISSPRPVCSYWSAPCQVLSSQAAHWAVTF